METILINEVGRVRREMLHGRPHLVAPLTLIVPGVLNGSKGPLYYPPEEISKNVQDWNGMPLVAPIHPVDEMGNPLSARTVEMLNKYGVGTVLNAKIEKGKLTAEGWFDVENLKRVDKRVLHALEQNHPVELSTGLYTKNELAQNGSVDPFTKRAYTHTARNYKPDHVAILPDQQGACSIRDGCGVLVNQASSDLLAETLALNVVYWEWVRNCKTTGKPGPCTKERGTPNAPSAPSATPKKGPPSLAKAYQKAALKARNEGKAGLALKHQAAAKVAEAQEKKGQTPSNPTKEVMTPKGAPTPAKKKAGPPPIPDSFREKKTNERQDAKERAAGSKNTPPPLPKKAAGKKAPPDLERMKKKTKLMEARLKATRDRTAATQESTKKIQQETEKLKESNAKKKQEVDDIRADGNKKREIIAKLKEAIGGKKAEMKKIDKRLKKSKRIQRVYTRNEGAEMLSTRQKTIIKARLLNALITNCKATGKPGPCAKVGQSKAVGGEQYESLHRKEQSSFLTGIGIKGKTSWLNPDHVTADSLNVHDQLMKAGFTKKAGMPSHSGTVYTKGDHDVAVLRHENPSKAKLMVVRKKKSV